MTREHALKVHGKTLVAAEVHETTLQECWKRDNRADKPTLRLGTVQVNRLRHNSGAGVSLGQEAVDRATRKDSPTLLIFPQASFGPSRSSRLFASRSLDANREETAHWASGFVLIPCDKHLARGPGVILGILSRRKAILPHLPPLSQTHGLS